MGAALRKLPLLAITLATLAAASACADETKIKLPAGPESVTVRANCSVCHSLDYLQMNSKFMDKAAWEAEVRKMVKVMGAPISAEDSARIVDYLTRNFGVEH
jgi:cytochrome c5